MTGQTAEKPSRQTVQELRELRTTDLPEAVAAFLSWTTKLKERVAVLGSTDGTTAAFCQRQGDSQFLKRQMDKYYPDNTFPQIG
jgi:hypothetical protein